MSDCPKCGCGLNAGIFQDYCPVCEGGIVGVGSRADLCVHIAELDAENDALRKQSEILATARKLESVERKQAEAELAALKAQRCDNCEHYEDNMYCPRKGESYWAIRSDAFSCCYWDARAEEGSTP